MKSKVDTPPLLDKCLPPHLLISCEHGGNRVPGEFQKMFSPFKALLQTHRGWDPGTLQLGEQWCNLAKINLHYSTTTRLLIDLNRSEHHRRLFSEITRALSADEQENVKAKYYRPHRQVIIEEIHSAIGQGQRVVHIALHSFTPELDGQVRQAEVGLLYDPRRVHETAICQHWRAALKAAFPEFRVRMNYPYRGTSDGLTTALRRQFPADRYVGVELEVNQSLVQQSAHRWNSIRAILIETWNAIQRLSV